MNKQHHLFAVNPLTSFTNNIRECYIRCWQTGHSPSTWSSTQVDQSSGFLQEHKFTVELDELEGGPRAITWKRQRQRQRRRQRWVKCEPRWSYNLGIFSESSGTISYGTCFLGQVVKFVFSGLSDFELLPHVCCWGSTLDANTEILHLSHDFRAPTTCTWKQHVFRL